MPEKSLTSHQLSVYKQLEKFIENPEAGVFILKGYAGTGKTFLLQYLARQLSEQKRIFTLLASTGRAASVLRSKTNFTATTIHSELYKFTDVDGDDEYLPEDATREQYGQMKLLFYLRGKDEENGKKIYIVDEASMIGNVPSKDNSYATFGSGCLLNDLMDTAEASKIIFTGDPCQLPPVFQEISPALSGEWFAERHYNVKEVELTEIVRQRKESGVLRLATKVRNMIGKQFMTKWIKLPAKNTPSVFLLPHQLMKEKYKQYTDENGFDNTIAICNSNFSCYDINNYIRRNRYNTNDAPLQIGDILMITQNNHIIPLVNGDFAEVIAIGDSRIHCGFTFLNVAIKSKYNDKNYETLLCLDTLLGGHGNLTQDQQKTLMIDFAKRMRKVGIKRKSQEYKDALRKDPYLNSLRTNFGYAVTCHKSQGGEWDTVFLFLKKGMYQMESDNLIRWWYTGITRAKEKLYITDDWWIR